MSDDDVAFESDAYMPQSGDALYDSETDIHAHRTTSRILGHSTAVRSRKNTSIDTGAEPTHDDADGDRRLVSPSIGWWLWLYYWFSGSAGLPLAPWFANRSANAPTEDAGIQAYGGDSFLDRFFFNYFRGCSGSTIIMLFLWLFFILGIIFIVIYMPSISSVNSVYYSNPDIMVPSLAVSPPVVYNTPGALQVSAAMALPPPNIQQRQYLIRTTDASIAMSLCATSADCVSGEHYAFFAAASMQNSPDLVGLRILGTLCAPLCTALPPPQVRLYVPAGASACVCTQLPVGL